jgi:hypothetical protein
MISLPADTFAPSMPVGLFLSDSSETHLLITLNRHAV